MQSPETLEKNGNNSKENVFLGLFVCLFLINMSCIFFFKLVSSL